MINIRKLEAELWESADLLRAGSKLTSNQYCMPVLGLIFLRYAYSRFKMVEAGILKNRPSRGGRVMPVEASDFAAKSALFLPKEAQYDYLVNLPSDISSAGLVNKDGDIMNSLGEVVNNAMALVEDQSEQLVGVLPKDYTMFNDDLLGELLRIFNNSALDEVGGDIIGRIYQWYLTPMLLYGFLFLVYIRVSITMQVDVYSLDAQRDKRRKYAEYQNIEIVQEFADEGL